MRRKGSKINEQAAEIPQDFETMIKGKCKRGTCPQKVRGKRFIAQWWGSGIRGAISAPPRNPASPTPGKHTLMLQESMGRADQKGQVSFCLDYGKCHRSKGLDLRRHGRMCKKYCM